MREIPTVPIIYLLKYTISVNLSVRNLQNSFNHVSNISLGTSVLFVQTELGQYYIIDLQDEM